MSAAAAQARPRSAALGLSAPRDITVIAAGVLTLLAVVLRASQIGQSLIGDETFTYTDIVGKSFSAVLSGVHTGGENSPPLFFLLAYLSIKIGDPTIWIRLPSIIFGAAVIPVIYAIGRQTIGRWAGVLAAALVALSPFTLYYGVEARPYATMMFFVAFSTLALLRALATRSRWWWAAYAVSVAAAAYSHYTAIFVLLVQALWSLWRTRRRLAPALIANGAVAIAYLPWLPHVRGKGLSVIAQLEPLTAHNVVTDLARALVGYPYARLKNIPTTVGLFLSAACLLAGLGWWLWTFWRGHAGSRWRFDCNIALLASLALTTPIGLLLYSLADTDLWLARGLTASLPAAALVIAYTLSRLPRPAAVATIVVVVAVLTLGTLKALRTPYIRGPFRTLASYLDSNARPSDPVVYISIVGQPAITEMLRKPHYQTTLLPLLAHPNRVSADARLYVILDDFLRQILHVKTVGLVPGYGLVSQRHFAGLFPTDVLIYRPRR